MPTDPLDTLREPLVPRPPRAAFAAELRRRLETTLGPTQPGGTMATTGTTETAETAAVDVRPRTITPYLTAKGAARAIEFYRQAFGATETFRMEDDTGRIGHAEIDIAGIVLMLSDEHPELGIVSPETLGGAGLGLTLPVDDVDATYERALAAGATGLRPPADQFYGERAATLLDPFGHRWTVSRPVEQVSVEDLAVRAPDYTVTAAEPGEATAAPLGDRPLGELGYFTLSVPDVDRAAAFYGALLGWRAEPARPSSEGGGHLYRHVHNTALPMGFHDELDDRSPHHYYRVADLQTMVARVRELGGEVLEVSDYASGGSARCRDDQGIEFDLWQAAPGY